MDCLAFSVLIVIGLQFFKTKRQVEAPISLASFEILSFWVSMEFQESLKIFSRKFKGCLKEVQEVFKGWLKGVLRVFYEYFKEI